MAKKREWAQGEKKHIDKEEILERKCVRKKQREIGMETEKHKRKRMREIQNNIRKKEGHKKEK